jgi:hypothetical protein
MADPPTGGPEPFPTNTQESIANTPGEELQATGAADRSGLISETQKRTRSGDAFAPSDPAGRITTKEVWKLISTLKDVIRHQTAVIAATQNDLQEIKHSQNVLQEQNEKLYEGSLFGPCQGNACLAPRYEKSGRRTGWAPFSSTKANKCLISASDC